MHELRPEFSRFLPVAASLLAFAASPACALTLSYAPAPLHVNEAAALCAPTLSGGGDAAAYSLFSGALPPGVSLDPESGVLSGTPGRPGTFKARIRAVSGADSALADLLVIVVAAPNGPSGDRPVYQSESHGAFSQPWGAAGFAWPQQLFFNGNSFFDSHYFDMIYAADGCESAGLTPLLGCVAWGYEYTACTGGDAKNGIADMSGEDGWGEYGRWMSAPEHAKYRATNWNGQTEAGYVTPLMPMDRADWPAEWGAWPFDTDRTTFGQWEGYQLGSLALLAHCRGIMCADYVVGLEWGDAIDYNERILDDFAAWAKMPVPGATVTERADYIQEHAKRLWYDYKCNKYALFYTTTARVLLAHGKTPMVGGQLPGYPALCRGSAIDTRLYAHGENALEGRNWFFDIELQSDSLRDVSAYWLSAFCMGSSACYEPDIPLGAQMDAFGGQGAFDAALANGGKDAVWGAKFLKHQWLSVGWTHCLGRDGLVHRAPQSFMRSYWDAGHVDPAVYDTMLAHIPRHPFGPAMYYSRAIQNSFEIGNGKNGNSWWDPQILLTRELSPVKKWYPNGAARGLCFGMWSSDAGLDGVDPADAPSAWIVYDSDRLPSEERAKLEALAPVIDISPDGNTPDTADAARLLDTSPVHIAQADDQCLNGLAFVDQNDAVVVMVTNTLDAPGEGSLVFSGVPDGTYACNGLLGTPSATLVVSDGKGSFPLQVPACDTLVYEIPRLHRSGRDYTEWAAPQCEKSANGWYASWYGWFYNDNCTRRWIWHVAQGWQYVWEGSTPGSAWFWDDATASWWWSNRDTYPWLYHYPDGKWYLYRSGTAPARLFWDCEAKKYATF